MSEPDSRSDAEPEPAVSGEVGSPLLPTKKRSSGLRWIIEVAVIVAAAFVFGTSHSAILF